MKYKGKWYQKVIRYLQVKWYLITKRYRPVPGGINFYADMKKDGIGVKGYYWRPMEYKTELISIDKIKE